VCGENDDVCGENDDVCGENDDVCGEYVALSFDAVGLEAEVGHARFVGDLCEI
jgi:hypothetical protein